MTTYQERAAHAAKLLAKHYAASAPESATRDQLTSLLRLRREHPEQFDRLGPVARMAVGFHDQAEQEQEDGDDDAA